MSDELTSRKEVVGGPVWHCNCFLLLENAREKHCQHLPEEEFYVIPALSPMKHSFCGLQSHREMGTWVPLQYAPSAKFCSDLTEGCVKTHVAARLRQVNSAKHSLP